MKDIAIYGAGGLGREVACLIQTVNKIRPEWNLVGFFDDNYSLKDQMISHYAKCLGGMNELNNYVGKLALVIAVGNTMSLRTIRMRITNTEIFFPNLMHPDVIFSDADTFMIGEGNIIQHGCLFSCSVTIGNFNILNGEVACGHDVIIGSYNAFMPDTRISGEVIIGDDNFFGVGSIVLQQIRIGNDVRLGAGSVLMTKPKNGFTYIGNPAKKYEF